MRTLAVQLAEPEIRASSVHPTQVNTPMLMNDMTYKIFRPDLESPGLEDFAPISQIVNVLAVP